MFGGLLYFLGKKPAHTGLDLGELKNNKKNRVKTVEMESEGVKKIKGGSGGGSGKEGEDDTSAFFQNASYTPSGKSEEKNDEKMNSASKTRTRSSSKASGKENSPTTKSAKKRRHKSDTVNREFIKTRRRLSSSI